jgi:flagellar basal body-associated protein FliL
MTGTESDVCSAGAKASFWRLIIYLAVAGVLMVAAALYYFSLYGPLTPSLVITITIGVFVSIMLGGGLMAAGFLSSNSGHDERAAAATTAIPPLQGTAPR